LIALFAAAAGLALYGFTLHKVEVNVLSKGTISDQRGKIVEKYLVTDAGNIPMNDTLGIVVNRVGMLSPTAENPVEVISSKYMIVRRNPSDA